MRTTCLLAISLVVTACSDKSTEPAPASGAPASTGGAASGARPAGSQRRPAQPSRPKRQAEPSIMKSYHAERCYIGLVALKFAHVAVDKSLGKDRPGPKVPDLGTPEVKSGNPAFVYQRLARVCNAAGSSDKPAHEELDKALDAAVEVGPPLGQALVDAADYYGKKEHEKDKFEKGRELHKTMKAAFEKLDAVTKQVGDALAAYKTAFPSKWEAAPAQKSQAAIDKAMAAFELLAQGKDAADVEKALADVTTATAEIEAAVKALKGDAYGAFMPKALTTFVEKAKVAATEKTPGTLALAAGAMENVLEAQNNAYKRDISGYVEPSDGPMRDPHHGMK